jgi:hypothetical protein
MYGFWGKSSRILGVEWLTDIGSRAGRARLYSAVDEATVWVATIDACGVAARTRGASSLAEPVNR